MKKNNGTSLFNEFKDFIMRGNVLDLAVGVIIGAAFGSIVTSLVNDIIMPLIGVIIGGINFSNLSIKVVNAKVNYGMFIQNIINFLIIAACIFALIKAVNKFTKKKEEKKEVKPDENLETLKEIRDLLKQSRKK